MQTHRKTMKLLTKKQVTELLGVSPGTVDNFHRKGILPRVMISSRTIRYLEADVYQLINKRLLI
jgi:predicted DNA-binding transcriptional regulator AlpA